MSVTPSTTHSATATSRRQLHRRSGQTSTSRPHTRPRRTAQPLHEALAIGLGCTSTGYRLSTHPEWR